MSTPTAERVWINAPSTLQPYHKYHGKRGLAVADTNGYARVYFTDGNIVSMRIDRRYLSTY